jgi:sulfate transport system ATP-binding protein
VGLVFQHYALFRHMTVFENVAFGLRVRPRALRPSEAQIREKVQALLSLVQLDWLADRYPAQLSGGQRQRIALARALAVEPRVLLLDEPFGALDAKVRKELRRWLRRLHDDLNVTTLFVTHDQEEALEVADRVVIMNKGKIEQVGAPHAVWESPASPFVYGFLGDVYLFHGRAHEGQVHLSEQALSLQSPEHEHLQDTKVMAFIRPHDFYVRRYRAEDQGMTARLNRVVLVGPIARMELEVLEGSQAAVPMRVVEVQISATEWKDQNFKEGEILLLSPRKAKVFLAEVA